MTSWRTRIRRRGRAAVRGPHAHGPRGREIAESRGRGGAGPGTPSMADARGKLGSAFRCARGSGQLCFQAAAGVPRAADPGRRDIEGTDAGETMMRAVAQRPVTTAAAVRSGRERLARPAAGGAAAVVAGPKIGLQASCAKGFAKKIVDASVMTRWYGAPHTSVATGDVAGTKSPACESSDESCASALLQRSSVGGRRIA